MTRRVIGYSLASAVVLSAVAVPSVRLAGTRLLAVVRREPSAPSIAELALSAGSERVHAGQIAGWPHRPLRASRGDAAGPATDWALLSKAAQLQRAMQRAPSAE